MVKLQKFYFTFGSDDCFPYNGGWVTVTAPSEDYARDIFCMIYSKPDQRFAPFAFCYPEENFLKSNMAKNGNLGAKCHKEITFIITDPQEETK